MLKTELIFTTTSQSFPSTARKSAKMFLQDNLIKYTRSQLNIQKILGTCSIAFDLSNQKLIVCSTKNLTWVLNKTKISVLYFVLLLVQSFHARKNEGFATKLENAFFVTDFLIFTAVKWIVNKRCNDIKVLFNLFFQFEINHLKCKLNQN